VPYGNTATICCSRSFPGLYLLPFTRLLRQGTDEGQLVYGAVRVAHGQVFARDFFEVVAPGTFYWLALFFKLFAVTFVAARMCLFLTSLGTGVSSISCRAEYAIDTGFCSVCLSPEPIRNALARYQPSCG
jgi:hypothetical protein